MSNPLLSPQPAPPPMPAMPPSTETSKYLYATKSHTPTPICHCGMPQETTYHHPLITCASKRCKTRYYHMHCADLTHQHFLSNEPWFCRDCRLAQTIMGVPTQVLMLSPPPPLPRVCVCEEPPYIMGPMVQCARKAKCEVRWFHCVCVGFPEEEAGWVCEACEGLEDVPEPATKRVKISLGAVEDEVLSPRGEGEVEAEEGGNLGKLAHHDCAVHGVQMWEEAVALSMAGKRDGVAVVEQQQVNRVEEAEAEVEEVLEVLEKRRDGMRAPECTATETTTPESPAPKSTTPEATILELTTTEPTAPESTTTEPGYCFCGTPDTNDMIACDAKGCATEWFHFTCVGLTPQTVPKGKWLCDECAEKAMKRRRVKVAGRKRKR